MIDIGRMIKVGLKSCPDCRARIVAGYKSSFYSWGLECHGSIPWLANDPPVKTPERTRSSTG